MNPTRTMRRQRGGVGSIPTRVAVDESPCTLDPTYWDAPAGDDMKAERPRVKAAQDECRKCPSLAACLKFLATWPHPDGVVAGQVWRDGKRLA